MDGLGGLRGWQWLFIIEGLVTSIYGLILKVTPLPSDFTARPFAGAVSSLELKAGHCMVYPSTTAARQA